MEQKSKKEYVDGNVAKSVKKRQSKKRKQKNNNVLMLVLGLILGIVIGVMGAIIVFDRSGNKFATIDEETEQQLDEATNYMDEMLEEKGFVIETPVVDLYYPEKWNDFVRVEQIEGDFHTVQFFATIEGKNEIQLFDVLLGGEEGYLLGYIKGENNEEISVNIVSYDFELGDDWTSEEETLIYAMLEDVNYIIGMLQKEVGFERAQ